MITVFPIYGKINAMFQTTNQFGNEDQGKRLKKEHFKWRLSKEKKENMT